MKLILMRHAKSSWDDPFLADHDRPLNTRGQRSAAVMGEWLRRNGHVPDRAVSSTSVRTCETFERLEFGVPVRFTGALYHAVAEKMMDVLQAEAHGTLLMLGHNPGMAEFAERLVQRAPAHDRFCDFPTCATLVLELETPGWEAGRVLDFAIPREVPQHRNLNLRRNS
ncbi:MAG: histidine phosphatase family protein [Pseudomonadota bacterium]